MRRLVIWILISSAIGMGQTSLILRPKVLQASSEKVLSVPAFGFFGPAQSDSGGNIFIHPGSFQDVHILKISPSSDTVVYQLPHDLAADVSFYEYSISPSGTVWVLANTTGQADFSAFRFSSTGELKSSIKLGVPDKVETKDFLALENDTLLIAGYYNEKAPDNLRGHSFVGLFDATGKLVKNLRDSLNAVDLAKTQGSMHEGGCAAGDGGVAYFVDAGKILVLNPAGEITKRIPFDKPARDLLVGGIYVSQGEAAVRLVKIEKDHTMQISFLVVDLSNGETVGWYFPPEGKKYGDVGFSRKEGFLFYGSDEHQNAKLIRAELN